MNIRAALLIAASVALVPGTPSGARCQTGEYVRVEKVQDDNLVIVRADGAMYLIEKGVGCLSAWRYEGKRVLILSPGMFLGVGSRLLLPDSDQECRIWDSEQLSPGQMRAAPEGPARPAAPVAPGATPPAPNLSGACYESTIMSPSPFMGKNGEVFRLADGSLWEVKYEYEYLYEYLPEVIICPTTGKLAVGGKTLNVQQIGGAIAKTRSPSPPSDTPVLIESRINGEFQGWSGETIFKLMNGQLWQQVSYAYTYHYAYSPGVLIYRSGSGYEMRVEGVESQIIVRRLR